MGWWGTGSGGGGGGEDLPSSSPLLGESVLPVWGCGPCLEPPGPLMWRWRVKGDGPEGDMQRL